MSDRHASSVPPLGVDEVRDLLSGVAERMPPVAPAVDADLVDVVRLRARRITRQRTARRSVLVAASVAVVVVGVGGLLPTGPSGPDGTPGPAAPALPGGTRPDSGGRPARSEPGPSTVPPQTLGPAVPASTGPAASGGVSGSPAAPGSAGPVPVTGAPDAWGAPTWQDRFEGAALDRGRWTLVYDGGANTPFSSWSASDVTVTGGAVGLTVTREGGQDRVATSGGIGAATSAARDGRWEVRWKMTAGRGVLGQFGLVASSETGTGAQPRYLATLDPAARSVVLEDTGAGRRASITVDPSADHSVAIELGPGSVRWLVDGVLRADWPVRPGATPVWPVLQTLLAGPDCGASPLPADCGAALTPFPQELSVDRVRFWSAG